MEVKEDQTQLKLKVQEILDKRRGIQRIKLKNMAENKRLSPTQSCKCSANLPLIGGWEGTAILTHGSLIKFGCVSFVFSIPQQFQANTINDL